MPLSSSSLRRLATLLALLGPVAQAYADEPTAVTHEFRESMVGVPADPARVGPGATLPMAPTGVPSQGRRSSYLPSNPPLPKPRPEDAKVLLAIMRNEKVGKLPLDLTVENATLEEIAARVQEKLPPTAPKIEVREARPIRLSFALKDSTVKEVLECAAAIAGAKLWVLPDRLLLAPETARSKADGTGQSVMGALPFPNGGRNDVQRVFSSLIADELSAKLTPNAQASTSQATGLLPSAETTFDKLSPEAQEMLRGLVDRMNDSVALRAASIPRVSMNFAEFKLSPTTLVQLNSGAGGSVSNGIPRDVLSIKEGAQGMEWSTDGSMTGRSFGRPLPSKPSSATPPPFLDPSAHKS